MREVISIFRKTPDYKSIIEGVNFISLLLLVFWLPFKRELLPYFIDIWIITWLLEGNFVKKFKDNIKNRQQLLLILTPAFFYVINVISYFYSENKSASLFDLEVKLSLFIFPLIFLTANYLYKKYWRTVLNFFIVGNIIASVLCIVIALIHSTTINSNGIIFNFSISDIHTNESFFILIGNRVSNLSYVYISKFLHPSYFSLYLVFGITIAYFLYKTSKKQNHKIVYIISILLFYVMTYLLSSRAGLLSLSMTLILLTIIELIIGKKYFVILLVSFILNYGVYKAITVSRLKVNIKESISKNEEKGKITKTKDARLFIWENAISVIKNNLLYGVGNGDAKDELIKQYKRSNFKKGIENNLNSHNQFFDTTISGGIIGLASLLIMFLSLFYYSIKQKHLILGFFVLLLGFNFLFESMLNTISGVVFTAFFAGFLVIYTPIKLKKPE